jgi:hypothetical protein
LPPKPGDLSSQISNPLAIASRTRVPVQLTLPDKQASIYTAHACGAVKPAAHCRHAVRQGASITLTSVNQSVKLMIRCTEDTCDKCRHNSEAGGFGWSFPVHHDQQHPSMQDGPRAPINSPKVEDGVGHVRRGNTCKFIPFKCSHHHLSRANPPCGDR